MKKKRSTDPATSDTPATGDDFYHRVYQVVALIPTGRVTSYGAIAAYLGLKSSARMVGYALNGVAGDMELPCHRVVNRAGELSGKHHFATPTLMRDLLESEGVEFKGEAVLMAKHFWDPAIELAAKRKPRSLARTSHTKKRA
ncbi:MAG: MGMT family protein [Bacteroidetes bacterium]|nr:MGMT family protein [Bacteroidota bacterium]